MAQVLPTYNLRSLWPGGQLSFALIKAKLLVVACGCGYGDKGGSLSVPAS